MKTGSRKKKPIGLDAILAAVEADIATVVANIAAERRANPPTPRRRPRSHHPKGHAHAA